MTLSVRFLAVALATALLSCSAAPSDDLDQASAESNDLRKKSPCDTVRCAHGSCAVHKGRAVCECGPNTQLCTVGHHYDGSPGVCACVADACPPNTLLCTVGHHYDGTPGVCACVADACPPNTLLCTVGHHYDGTPGVCACVADACPPQTMLCIQGSHYDSTPGVCRCVAN